MDRQPGWYDDPSAAGMVRWWDGERWLDMVMPAHMAPRPASTTEKVAAVAGLLAKAWFLGLLLVVCLVVIWIVLG